MNPCESVAETILYDLARPTDRPKSLVSIRRRGVMDELARCQIDGYKVIRGLCRSGIRCRMVLDTELLGIGNETRITEILIVVVFEHHRVAGVRQRGLRHGGTQRRTAFVSQRIYGMAAIADNEKRSLPLALRASETLVVMRVAG